MARPRIFISSTYYDLKDIRESLEGFIRELGFEPILSEIGNIPYSPDTPLDESCYREAGNSDIFVLIIGGRYGSEWSGGEREVPKSFFDQYDSITKKEYEKAVARDVPTYILIEKAVYSEFEIYQRNKDNEEINYAQVDSANIFRFIDDILSKPKNNPIHKFDKLNDIKKWLREQWSGLFQTLLGKLSDEKQLTSLSAQVKDLSEVSSTLKKYMETVVTKVVPKQAAGIIMEESKRLKEAQNLSKLRRNDFFRFFLKNLNFSVEDFEDALNSSQDFTALRNKLISIRPLDLEFQDKFDELLSLNDVQEHLNDARAILGLEEFNFH
ncbi:MAG: DUF4062 domain-containing protein [candidate division Zixibacteria bacterium]|nr:DUF4062 domain-containing protein [candidate division Zixibacteria bacterium]